MFAKKIVGLGGTSRLASSSERLVRAVLKECDGMGAETMMFGGSALSMLPISIPNSRIGRHRKLRF